MPKPLYSIAHRGGINDFTENSLACINQCLKENAVDAIEIDVWKIHDQLVVTHDRELGDTLDGRGRLTDLDPTVLSELKTKMGEPIATLAQIIKATHGHCELNIELKGPDSANGVIGLIKELVTDLQCNIDQLWVSSFDHQQLYQCQKLLPELRRGVLVAGIPYDFARACTELNAYALHGHLGFITKPFIDDAKSRGVKTFVYTVNREDDFSELSNLGVDGVFTDYPDKLACWNKRL